MCKEHGIPQYGDKATLISRILERAENLEYPGDGGGDGSDRVDRVGDAIEVVDEVDHRKIKSDKLVQLMKDRNIGGFSGKKKEELPRKLQRYDEETARVANEKVLLVGVLVIVNSVKRLR